MSERQTISQVTTALGLQDEAVEDQETAAQQRNIARTQLTQKLAFGLLWLAGSLTVAIMLAVVGYVVVQGAKVINFPFLLEAPRGGLAGEGGISTTIITTVYLVLLVIAIASPFGVGAAVYLVEYAGEMRGRSGLVPALVQVARFGVETLAGVPSIIFGLFGYALFVVTLKFGFSLLSAALAGACLVLPTIIRTTEEALLTVPRSYREGSLALGSTKWQTNWRVVLPTAIPGIVTGIILGVGRIVSETAVFYVTLGGSINFPESVMDQGRTMVLHLYSLMMDANAPDPAMGTALIIIVVIVSLNLAINYFSSRLSRSMRGG